MVEVARRRQQCRARLLRCVTAMRMAPSAPWWRRWRPTRRRARRRALAAGVDAQPEAEAAARAAGRDRDERLGGGEPEQGRQGVDEVGHVVGGVDRGCRSCLHARSDGHPAVARRRPVDLQRVGADCARRVARARQLGPCGQRRRSCTSTSTPSSPRSSSATSPRCGAGRSSSAASAPGASSPRRPTRHGSTASGRRCARPRRAPGAPTRRSSAAASTPTARPAGS